MRLHGTIAYHLKNSPYIRITSRAAMPLSYTLSKMGLQSRLPKLAPTDDLEKLPLTNEPETIKDHPKSSKSALSLSLSAPALFLILLYLITPASIYQFDFPFPSKPTVLPPHVLEGIEQCKVLQRPVTVFKPHDGRRKHSDRFVEGTGAVWLKNGTVWTGEDDGNEVLYGAGVWLEGGVIRKVGGEKELAEMKDLVKGNVEEVDLHGAWVTPGVSRALCLALRNVLI
jgi:hypothetical protein